MTDFFMSEDVRKLLRGKKIVYLGGSITRGLYKDLIWLLNSNNFMPKAILGSKGEKNFPDFSNPKLQPGSESDDEGRFFNNKDELHNCGGCPDDFKGINQGRNYTESREYVNEEHQITIAYK